MVIVQTISRTYAQVVSGITTKMVYDSSSKDFQLQYFISRVCTDNTTQVWSLVVCVYVKIIIMMHNFLRYILMKLDTTAVATVSL